MQFRMLQVNLNSIERGFTNSDLGHLIPTIVLLTPAIQIPQPDIAVARKWYAPIPVSASDATRLNDDYTQLVRVLWEKSDVVSLIPELVNEFLGAPPAPPKLSKTLSTFLIEVIQLMENVYTEYRLEHAANRANPRNAGWMALFRRWARPETVLITQIWPGVKTYYNPMFQTFVDVDLRHDASRDWPERP